MLAFALLSACVAPRGTDAVEPPGRSASPAPAAEPVVPDIDAPEPDTADTGEPTVTEPAPPPILVVILADDLRADALAAMPRVSERLVPTSVQFTRAYTTVPLCCPVRASLLQGGWYPGQTGVLANTGPNGGVTAFDDTYTLATRLQSAGFATALLGKYLNGYELGVAPYVPPGWDLFLATTTLGDFTDTELYRGSSTPDAPGIGVLESTDGEHLTGWVFDEALAFLDAHPDQPAFVLLTPQSPHLYGTPAQEDANTFDGHAPRPPSFAEPDVSDKPSWMRNLPTDEGTVAAWDADAERMMENLVALDRGVGAFLDGLADRGLDGRATIVFTSDNGYLHGEHRFEGKGVPYEESVRVPLLVRAPGVHVREEPGLVAMNLDVPATIADLAGLPDDGEGKSLVPALIDPAPALREHVFLETSDGAHPMWVGVVTERWKYVEWGSGERELYDLLADPNELESRHADPPEEADVAGLAAWVDELRPLNVTTRNVPSGVVGVPYETTLGAWGGVPPLTWMVDGGVLPDGLALSADGVVSGTPTRRGAHTVTVRVVDGGASPVDGAPATYAQTLTFSVGEATMATAAREGGDARFRLPGRPSERVAVRLYLDDSHDTEPLFSGEGTVGEDGYADVLVRGVPATRAWSWAWAVDERSQRGGTVPR